MTTYWLQFSFNVTDVTNSNTFYPPGPDLTFLGDDLVSGGAQIKVTSTPLEPTNTEFEYSYTVVGVASPSAGGYSIWQLLYTSISNYYVVGSAPAPTQLLGPLSTTPAILNTDGSVMIAQYDYNSYAWAQITIPSPPLFTSGGETVDFDNLTSIQQTAIAGGANLYNGLGGSDVVTLPSIANYNEKLGSAGGTLNWDSSSTFSTGSLSGQTYTVSGSDGSYKILLGAGSDRVTISGNGSSTITGGTGSDTITISGNGHNIVNAGSGNEGLSISGRGFLKVDSSFVGSATIGAASTLELNGASSGGAITFGPPSASVIQSATTLEIDGTTMPTNVISGFAANDTIDLRGVGFTSSSTATLDQSKKLHVSAGGQTYPLQLDPNQDFSGQSFYLSSDGHGGTDVEVGHYKLVFAFSQSPGANGIIQAGKLTATLYFNDKPIGIPFSKPASCDDAFPLVSTTLSGAGGFTVPLPSPPSRVSPTIQASGNPTIVFNINNLAGGSNQNTVELHVGTVGGGTVAGSLQNSWNSESCLVVSQINFLTPLEQKLASLAGLTVDFSSTSSQQTLVNWINSNVDCEISSKVGLLQPKLSVSETSSSLVPGSTGTFEINISRPIEKTVMVLYSVTDTKFGATTMREALVSPRQFSSGPISFGSLFTSGSVPLIGASALTVMSDLPSGKALNSADFDTPLTKTAGDAYKIAIEGYAVEYQNQKGWYFDSQAGNSTDISDENLMFGIKETASFNIPLNVGSGQTSSGIVIAASEATNVLGGGTVVDTTVQGLLNVAAGGIADPTVIDSGGIEIVRRSGTDLGALISGGEQEVYGFASDATVFSGSQVVESGGTASGTTVSSGGTLELVGGAIANGFSINSGGTLEIALGYVLRADQLSSDATVAIAGGGIGVVSSGGTATNIEVLSGGTLDVLSGGTAASTTVLSGGTEIVSAHGTDDGANVSGGKQIVYGIASGATVFSGGSQVIESGGTASNTSVSSGGTETVLSGSTAGGATIVTGGTVTVSSGGTFEFTSGTTGMPIVRAGATLEVGSGFVFSGTVSSGIRVEILSGGVDSGVTVISGGREIVLSGGTASNTVVSKGGVETVSSGGSASGTMVSSGGIVNVLSGDTTFESATVFGGGKLTVSKGGTAHDIAVSSGGALNVAGTITSDVTVLSGGVETVASGGVVTGQAGSGTTVSGTVNVLSGGKFEFAVLSGGGTVNVSAGGIADEILVSSGGVLNVHGRTTGGVTVFAGGVETVSGLVSGSSVTDSTLSGGRVNVASGGRLSFATVSSGGELTVSKGGTAASIVVSSGGNLNLAGTTTGNVTVSSGGTETVSAGGIASGTTIAGGTLEIESGGSTGGKATFAANTGTLQLDATTFSGTVAGMTGQDTIDLRHFSFAASHVTSSIAATSATLTVTDGAQIAHIVLLGNYMGSTFTPSNDGFGGTSIIDPHVSAAQTVSLAQTHKG